MKRKPGYYVTTWDTDRQRFTPQRGIRSGPYGLFALRAALRKLEKHGYDVLPRESAISVMVEKYPADQPPTCPRCGELHWGECGE